MTEKAGMATNMPVTPIVLAPMVTAASTQMDGSPITLDGPCSIAAGTGSAHKELLEIVREKLLRC